MKKTEFVTALDFILNRCTLREIDAVEAAVKRRRSDLAASTGLTSLDPDRLAAEMNSVIQSSLETSMNGMRNSIREYAAGIIGKEAPELTAAQMNELLDTWIPAKQGGAPAAPNVPPDVLLPMIMQFTGGCLNTLSAAAETALVNELGADWAALFWKSFTPEIRSLIKARVDNRLDDREFQAGLAMLLQP